MFKLSFQEVLILVYLYGQKVVLMYDKLVFSLQVVYFLLHLTMGFLFIFPFMSLQDQFRLLLFQFLICKYTTLVTIRLLHSW
jgi:hypothetical protein